MTERTYTRDEVRESSLEYFGGDQLAADVFTDKYALMRGDVWLESSPIDMHRRLAKEFARIESKYINPMSEEEIFDMLDRFKYVVPQGSPMSAVGNPYQYQSLSNCFVIQSPYDSYGGILKADQEQAQIMKRRGGVGFDISTIRPSGLATANAARTTDGLGVFMQRFSNTTREVAQGGRRGALMLTVSCFAEGTRVLTEDGWMEIRHLVESEYTGKAWTHLGFKEIDAHQSLGEQDVYEVTCENGKKITVTSDHQFVVRNVETGEEYLRCIRDVDPEKEELTFYDVDFTGA